MTSTTAAEAGTPRPVDSNESRLRPSDLFGVGVLGLTMRRGRTVLTATGIAIGISAIVAVIGISASSRAGLLAQLDALGTNILEVSPGQSFGGSAAELPEDASAMLARVGPVTDVAAITTVDATVRRSRLLPETETSGLVVFASSPDLLAPLEGQVIDGVGLNDATQRYPAALLGSVAARRLGIGSLEASPTVHIAGTDFGVVGILAELPLAPNVDRSVIIGYPIAERLFGTDRHPSTIYLRTLTDAVDDVRAVVPATANPEAPSEVQVSRPSDALEARAAADVAFTALLLGLGAVALLVGGVGIANVMVVSVLERTAEIGVRRALGATRRHIAAQFVVEATLLSGIGGVAGVLLGALITVGYAVSQGWLVAVPALGLVAGVVAALVIGGVAGLYPARRAARLDPATAVHTE